MKPMQTTNWYCRQGEDFEVHIAFPIPDSSPTEYLDLTGREFRGSVRKKFGVTTAQSLTPPLMSMTCELVPLPPSVAPDNRAVRISISSAITASVKDGTYYFDVFEIDVDGLSHPVVSGMFVLDGRATV